VVEELEEIKERLKRIEERITSLEDKIREIDDRVGQLENIAVVTMVNAADKRFLGEEAKRSKRRRG
jgi:prefoldin subunit 5